MHHVIAHCLDNIDMAMPNEIRSTKYDFISNHDQKQIPFGIVKIIIDQEIIESTGPVITSNEN